MTDPSGAYHIDLQGQPAYPRRFLRVFGFYESLAAVKSRNGWYHIRPDGNPAYKSRWDWCGNFQEGFCPVRLNGKYEYINRDGNAQRGGTYRYAGDFRKGIAVVRRPDGLCVHIAVDGHEINGRTFLDLDVFHKGYARARDALGWFHCDLAGKPLYEKRYWAVENFYNGQALVESTDGARVVIDELGRTKVRVSTPPQAMPEVRRTVRKKKERV